MSDTINREYATRYFIGLQALDKITNDNYDGKITFEEVVSGLGVIPSAEPYTEEEIQAMQDLEQAQLDKAYELGWKEGREALSCSESPNSSDTIYRQDAIDAIFSEPLYESGMKKRDADAVVPAIYEKIKSLPSAEPKTPSNGSITSMNAEKMHVRTTDDCISRQDVLHELDGCDYELKDWQRWKLKTMVRDIPSAEPERKKGEWIYDNSNTFKCSKCNKYLGISCGNMKMNFCSNCGADMRGES